MRDSADVIIVGAGIIGCSIAHQLARRGARVRVFDARTIGAGATHASAGVLAPYIEAPRSGVLLDLAVRSLESYDEFIQTVSADAGVTVEYRVCGTLEVATDDEIAAHLRTSHANFAEALGADAVWLEPQELRNVEPLLPDDARGALLNRRHGYVAAPQLAEALTWGAMRHGAEIETRRSIVAVREKGGRIEVIAEDGTAWFADLVVIAAGSWASQIDISDPAAQAIRPVRGQLLRLTWPGDPPRTVIWGPDCYVVPWNDGSILVGATVEEVGFDEHTTAAGVRDLLDALCALLPDAWRATFNEARAGLRPASLDGLPILGPSETIANVVFATGHYRNGVLLAPVTARLITDGILNDRWDPILKNFHPVRFSANRGQEP